MKKSVAFLIFSIFLHSLAFCQTKKNAFSVSFGPSFPLSNFGSKYGFTSPTSVYKNSNQGYAKLGQYLSFSYERKIDQSFSFSTTVYGQRNSLDTKELESFFSNKFLDMNRPLLFKNWKFNKDKWFSTGLLIGGTNEFHITKNKNLTFHIKSMIGLVFCVSPNVYGSSYSGSWPNDTLAIESISSKSALGFCYSLGLGLNYNINSKHYLLLDVNYLATTNIRFKDTKKVYAYTFGNRSGSVQTYIAPEPQSIKALNINMGLGIRF